jgi:hypothetical protein
MKEYEADFPFRLISTMFTAELVDTPFDVIRDFEIIFIERENLFVDDCPVEL